MTCKSRRPLLLLGQCYTDLHNNVGKDYMTGNCEKKPNGTYRCNYVLGIINTKLSGFLLITLLIFNIVSPFKTCWISDHILEMMLLTKKIEIFLVTKNELALLVQYCGNDKACVAAKKDSRPRSTT